MWKSGVADDVYNVKRGYRKDTLADIVWVLEVRLVYDKRVPVDIPGM